MTSLLDSNQAPTPEEWVAWFDQLSQPEKIKTAEWVRMVAENSYQCFAKNHEHRLARCGG